MKSSELKQLIKKERFVPILRTDTAEQLKPVTQAVYDTGMRIIEFTMTTPGVIDVIADIKGQFPDMIIGLGTVYEPEDAKNAINNGADFIVSPINATELAEPVKSANKMLMLAGFTPTEIYSACKAGSDIIKLFPAKSVPPRYIKDVLAPMPFVDILPTGGLDYLSGVDFLNSGAISIGLGGYIFNKKWLKSGNYEAITERISTIRYRFAKLAT